MKTAAILHKGVNKNPTLMSALQVLSMATLEGAKALCWDNEIGSIEKGKKADLAIINFAGPHLHPVHNEISHLVYAVKSSDVETVIVNGKIVVENEELKTLKVENVIEVAEKAKNRLFERLKRNVK